ncbi:MAG: hypothetical protein EXR98_11505 [Gemmataceae bacterium]|nr:hypothetical protein [Gemmataceae bacterium]
MNHWLFIAPALVVALAMSTFTQAQETIKDRKAFIPSRKQAAVGGKAIGILLTDGQPVLSTEGRSGPADQLVFSSGGNSYRWIYVPTQDNPQITNLQVPVGDKGEKAVYAALNLANPRAVLPWAVTQSYALVELEVNGGRGSPAGDSFVATEIKVIENSKDFPLKVADVVKQVKARYEEYLVKQKNAIDKAMKDGLEKSLGGKPATGPRERKDLMYLTWLPESSTLRVHFRTTISDGAYTVVNVGDPRLPPRKLPLAPKGKVLPRDPGSVVFIVPEEFVLRAAPPKNFATKVGTTFGIEFGQAYIVNKKGEVTGTETLPIDSFTQQLNAPVGIGGPRPLPLPVPPVREEK